VQKNEKAIPLLYWILRFCQGETGIFCENYHMNSEKFDPKSLILLFKEAPSSHLQESFIKKSCFPTGIADA